jgi:hypothetical protein
LQKTLALGYVVGLEGVVGNLTWSVIKVKASQDESILQSLWVMYARYAGARGLEKELIGVRNYAKRQSNDECSQRRPSSGSKYRPSVGQSRLAAALICIAAGNH